MDGFFVNKFDAEAHRISNILNIWDFGFLVGALKRFAHEEPHHRMQLVLRDYFKQSDMNVPQSALENDVATIKSIFPECSVEEITGQLQEIGNEENRVRIVVKRLLRQNSNNCLKRSSPNLVEGNDVVASKRSKLAPATVVSGEDSRDGANEDSCTAEEAVASLVQTQQAADSESTIIDSSSHASQEVFVEKADTNLPHSPQLGQREQSDNKRTEVDQKSADSESTIIDSSSHASQDVFVEKADTNLPHSPQLGQREQSDNKRTEVDQILNFLIEDIDTIDCNSSGEGAHKTFNLYKHLKEMFADISKKDIKAVCATYNTNKHEKPGPGRLNAIITELLSMNPGPPGIVKDNFDESRNIVRLEKHRDALEDVRNSITMNVPEAPQPHVNEVNVVPMGTQQKDSKVMLRNTLRHLHADLTASLDSLASNHPIAHFRVPPAATVVNQHQPTVSRNADYLLPTQLMTERPIIAFGEDLYEEPNQRPPRVFGVDLNEHLNQRLLPRIFEEDHEKELNQRPPWLFGEDQEEERNQRPPRVFGDHKEDLNQRPPRLFAGDHNEELNQILKDLGEQASDDEVEEVAEIEEAVADNGLVYPLMEMFPEACPKFIRNMCMGKVNAPVVLDSLISRILELKSYPKRQKAASPERQLNSEEQLEILKQVLPDADPNYLQIHCDRLIDRPNELKMFIEQAIEHRNYPTMKDYLRKQQVSAQQKQYTTEFDLKKFLEVIPNPAEYFNDPKRKPAKIDMDSQHYALCFLRNHFNRLTVRGIRDVFRKQQENFLLTCKTLEAVSKSEHMKGKRLATSMPSAIQNIPLLQEIAYYEHRVEIETFLNQQKEAKANERKAAKQAGLLQTCSCCYDEEVMPQEIYMCENGCVFCKECVRRGAEVAFGDGKLDFVCLNDCASHFSLQTLQAVLQPKMFSKVALKKQLEEVKAAGIEDLEMCPFCDFATIPAREDKLFRCFNPECMKESCRLCKEPSHVPLRCEEVEKDDDVKRRTYIENKMTEALLRKCYKCGMKFIKADGCNKMTCSCGALMCYVCGQPVQDYKHFNGPGGDRTKLCPLYSDTNQLHQEAVLKGASEAKQEIGVTDPAQLKIDPTADIQQHYKQFAKKNPPPPYAQIVHIDPFQNLDPGMQQMQERLLQERHLQRLEEIRIRLQQLIEPNERALQRLEEIRNRHRQQQQLDRHRHNFHHRHHHQPHQH